MTAGRHNVGVAFALLGDADSAVVWLRRAADQGMPSLPLYERNSDLANLRAHSGFNALLDDLRRGVEPVEAGDPRGVVSHEDTIRSCETTTAILITLDYA